MSETRRQIFKTSILSAIGLMAVPALVACTTPFTIFGEGDPNVPIVGKGDGNDPYWYIFVFVPAAGKDGEYQVWKTKQVPPSDPAKRPFDTAQWYSSLKANNYLEPVSGSFTIDGHAFNMMDGSYLEPPSTSGLQYAARVKWSEIGKS